LGDAIITQAKFDLMEMPVKAEVDDAVQFALVSPPTTPSTFPLFGEPVRADGSPKLMRARP